MSDIPGEPTDPVKDAIEQALDEDEDEKPVENSPKDENKLNTPKEIQTKIVYVTQPCPQGQGRYIYSVFHTILTLIAIYLSFRCNNGFNLGPFLVAILCPYVYIIYTLSTKGTCGILEKK